MIPKYPLVNLYGAEFLYLDSYNYWMLVPNGTHRNGIFYGETLRTLGVF